MSETHDPGAEAWRKQQQANHQDHGEKSHLGLGSNDQKLIQHAFEAARLKKTPEPPSADQRQNFATPEHLERLARMYEKQGNLGEAERVRTVAKQQLEESLDREAEKLASINGFERTMVIAERLSHQGDRKGAERLRRAANQEREKRRQQQERHKSAPAEPTRISNTLQRQREEAIRFAAAPTEAYPAYKQTPNVKDENMLPRDAALRSEAMHMAQKEALPPGESPKEFYVRRAGEIYQWLKEHRGK